MKITYLIVIKDIRMLVISIRLKITKRIMINSDNKNEKGDSKI